jgi:hypothetical protein
MSVVRIDALCECEACAKRFGVEIELASELSEYEDFEDLVRETVSGGNTTHYTWGVRGKQTVERFPLSYHVTIQGELLLCDECSKKCDDLPIEGALTREQVQKALEIEVEQ